MPSLPRFDAVFGIPAPAEWTGVVGVVVRNISFDRCDAFLQRVENRILQSLPGELREDPLDGVHPRGRGRGDVEGPVGTALQPRVDFGRLVRRDVVADDVHRGFGRDPRGDRIADGAELRRAVPFDRPADDLAGGGVQGRQPAGRAVPPGVVRPRLGRARCHGPGRLRPSACLDLRFLVHREDDGRVGRVDVEADDVADLDRELRVARDLEGLDRGRPEVVTEEDVAHRGDDHVAHGLSQGPERPVPGVLRGRRHRQRDPGLHPVRGDRLPPRRAGGVPETPVDARDEEAVPPAPDRRLRQACPPQGLGPPASRAELQDDAGPPDRLLQALRVADDPVEARTLRVRKRNLLPCRFPAHSPVSCWRGPRNRGGRIIP